MQNRELNKTEDQFFEKINIIDKTLTHIKLFLNLGNSFIKEYMHVGNNWKCLIILMKPIKISKNLK